MRSPWKQPSVIPGFGLTLGYTLLCLSVIALLGPSGSGKTTPLRINAGLDEPEASDNTQFCFEARMSPTGMWPNCCT